MEIGVHGTGSLTNRELLLEAYAAYNRRDSDALLALVSEDVYWPDGSARLHGKAEVRAYWTRQWAVTRTHDEPVEITELGSNRSVVRIRQVVRALDGSTISEGSFDHVYQPPKRGCVNPVQNGHDRETLARSRALLLCEDHESIRFLEP
jgi:hypothetical protein